MDGSVLRECECMDQYSSPKVAALDPALERLRCEVVAPSTWTQVVHFPSWSPSSFRCCGEVYPSRLSLLRQGDLPVVVARASGMQDVKIEFWDVADLRRAVA